MDDARKKTLKDADWRDGSYILYWMEQSQRAQANPALEYAVRSANEVGLPILVLFVVDAESLGANARRFQFMIEGLQDVKAGLEDRDIGFVVKSGNPVDIVPHLAEEAAALVLDRGYLRHQKKWREDITKAVSCRVVQVEGDVVVPIEQVSNKREYAARTIRPKIHDLQSRFIENLKETKVNTKSSIGAESDLDISDVEAVVSRLTFAEEVAPVSHFKGGMNEAASRLTSFLRSDLDGYADGRREPVDQNVSQLSPYLHFGQISPVEIVLKVKRAQAGSDDDQEAFLEELIIRRELAANFVHYEPDYDHFDAMPDWARESLDQHRDDERSQVYTAKQMENAETEDPYWNAAMKEMVKTGYMHNSMRMYWGKQIVRWCNTPEYAYEVALTLNNRYFLDGCDANSYANVGWIFGLHDQAFKETDVTGKLRPMTASGLERKFDMKAYVDWVETL